VPNRTHQRTPRNRTTVTSMQQQLPDGDHKLHSAVCMVLLQCTVYGSTGRRHNAASCPSTNDTLQNLSS